MANTQLQALARMGAQSRLAALDQERDEIHRMFPDLRNGAGRDGAAQKARKDHMSPESRKRQAKRMRAYWAERRAKAGAEGGSAKSATKRSSGKAAKRQGGMSAEARQRQAERMRAYWATKKEKDAASVEGAQAGAGSTGSARRKRRNK